MLVRDEADLIAYLTGRPGQAVFVLRGAGDEVALAALRRAADAVRAIPHPDEPGDPLPNRVDALLGDDGPTLHLDMQDHAQQAPRVIATVVAALEEATVDGTLEPLRPPGPPVDYDADADILPGVTFLERLDERGLPPAFPDGFPVPADATLVIAQRARNAPWEHAAWRRGTPFDEYPAELHRFGYELEAVTSEDRLTRGTGMTRQLLRHPAGTGSVSTYHGYGLSGAPRRWYVSVVWQPGRRGSRSSPRTIG